MFFEVYRNREDIIGIYVRGADLLPHFSNIYINRPVLNVLRKIQTLRVNNLRILTIKNTKLSRYYFYINLNILGDIQICISVPLRHFDDDIRLRLLRLKLFTKLRKDTIVR